MAGLDSLAPADSPLESLSYPVLCLARDASITVVGDARRLSQCNAVAFFRNRWFDDLVVIDSTATEYRVTRTEPLARLTGVRKWIVRATNARVEVRLSLSGGTRLSLAMVKARVRDWIRKAPDLWEASRDLSEWDQMVESAQDMRTLMRVLT